jgi:hypothetical protein
MSSDQKEGNGKYPHGFALSENKMINIRKFFIISTGDKDNIRWAAEEARKSPLEKTHPNDSRIIWHCR